MPKVSRCVEASPNDASVLCKPGHRQATTKERGPVADAKTTAVVSTKDGPHGQEAESAFIDADIAGFFDNIPHKLIIDAVAEEVADGNILDLVKRFLAAGVLENGIFKPTTIGTPQGGVISPLLANIVLNKLDWRLAGSGYQQRTRTPSMLIPVRGHTTVIWWNLGMKSFTQKLCMAKAAAYPCISSTVPQRSPFPLMPQN